MKRYLENAIWFVFGLFCGALFLTVFFLLTGCQIQPKVTLPLSVIGADGSRYVLVRPEHGHDIALWTREGVTNRFYTPTLRWTMNTNEPMTFNSVMP